MTIRRQILVVTVVLILGVALRVGYVMTLPSCTSAPDEYDYIASASGILYEGSFEKAVYFHVPPVVPIALAGLFAVTGPSIVGIRLFQCVLFVVLGLVLFGLGYEIKGWYAGLFASLFGAFYPYFIFYSGRAQTETIGTIMITLLMLLGVRAVRLGRWYHAFAFGGVLALAALTRSSALYFVFAVPLVFAIGWGVRDGRWIRGMVVTILGFLLLYCPWVAVNYSYFGVVLPTPTIGGGVMLYQAALRTTMPDDEERLKFLKGEVFPKYYYLVNGTDADRLAGDRFLNQQAVKIIRENPRQYAGVILTNLKGFWKPYPQGQDSGSSRRYKFAGLMSFGVLTPFFITGLVDRLRNFPLLSVLYGFMTYFTLVHILISERMRYRVPMDGLFLVFAAVGVVYWLSRLFPGRLERTGRQLGFQAAGGEGREV